MQKINSEEKFLKQSYNDAWQDFQYILTNKEAPYWDWVAITASNERQAASYRAQIQNRLEKGIIPNNTNYIVVPDLNNKRIGSGGATLNVLKVICEQIGKESMESQKILVIHSGGDSKRIPQYSACGKLFSPIPRYLPNGQYSTLFDELLISIARVPSRISAGMLVLPGDTELLFNPLQLELLSCDAAGLSIKANIEEGKQHGVFVGDENNLVCKFLHKQSEDVLRKNGAVDARDDLNIDTGCIWLKNNIVKDLLELFWVDEEICKKKFEQFVNDKVRLSFYADFVSVLSKDITWEEYQKEIPEGEFSDELTACRKEIWNKLKGYTMSLIKMTPARYIHVGRTDELYRLMVSDIEEYDYLGWNRNVLCTKYDNNVYSGINSFVGEGVTLPNNCYIEHCVLKRNVYVDENVILSGITVNDITFPANTVFHCVPLKNGKFVCRVYGIEDNPKGSLDSQFLGSTLRELLILTSVDIANVWTDKMPSIWNAKIYTAGNTCEEAVNEAITFYKIISGSASESDVSKWKASERYSLESSFNNADVEAMIIYQEKITKMVNAQNCVIKIQRRKDILETISELDINKKQELEWIEQCADNETDLFKKIRLYLLLSYVYKNEGHSAGKEYEDIVYELVKKAILESTGRVHFNNEKVAFCKNKVEVKLPVRVNFCGSPSDAAPYCLEYGGTMLDGALFLRGKLPIKVEIERLQEPVVRLISEDLKCEVVCTETEQILECGNPYDTFALHKAIMIASNILPYNEQRKLKEICQLWGGGISIKTSVDVPKGSGLGTSSILAAAAIKGLHEIFGQTVNDDQIYAEVFLAEQLMNTGGGWQDQAGGLTPGIKFMYTSPGTYQKIQINEVDLQEEIKRELQSRFVLIFSGQRRLARNVLREEMNKCIINSHDALDTVEEIRKLCVLMRFELERGNITQFAKLITSQFELVKKLDKGASNTCIEYIFDCCEDLIDGKSICGAGGGGFLQVILKEGVTKEQLRRRISERFNDCGVEVWDSEFFFN